MREKQDSGYVTAARAFRYGSLPVKLSVLIWGLGCLRRKQAVRGGLLCIVEAAVLHYMFTKGVTRLMKLCTLGDAVRQKVWDEEKNIFVYVAGDRSLVILLYGIITIAILIFAVGIARCSLKWAYEAECAVKNGRRPSGWRQDLHELSDRKLHCALLSLPILGTLAFTVLPLVFMMSMAFTDYSVKKNKLVLFDWVGLANFKSMINWGGALGHTFWRVLAWTILWAVLATFFNYMLGVLLSLLINWREIRGKKFWRFCFVMTVAVPHFVTLLIIHQILQPEGAVNVLLRNWGVLAPGASFPFFTSALWARVSVVLINVWVGVPYVLLQVTGILQNIPPELYEAARIDGAGPKKVFFKITMPYMLFVTTPYLITSFVGNVNNFNVIFLTSGGYPRSVGETAGKTDLLITWLYKLTIENQYFDVGAVIGIMTFITLAFVSLITFRMSGSYRNEEGFR